MYINDVHKSLTHASIALFSDDAALSHSSTFLEDLQLKLNLDLNNVTCWLAKNKLTLNTSKSKFMFIADSKKLKDTSHFRVTVNDCAVGRESTFKYLGIAVTENLSWSDHIEFVRKKASRRLAVLPRRIKHLLPFYARNLFENPMVLPFLNYCDIVWGDRNNEMLMDSLQVLHNKAAKIVLDRPVYSSSTQVLLDLKWKDLRVRRRIHRPLYVFKCLNGLLDRNFDFNTGLSVHNYQSAMPTI